MRVAGPGRASSRGGTGRRPGAGCCLARTRRPGCSRPGPPGRPAGTAAPRGRSRRWPRARTPGCCGAARSSGSVRRASSSIGIASFGFPRRMSANARLFSHRASQGESRWASWCSASASAEPALQVEDHAELAVRLRPGRLPRQDLAEVGLGLHGHPHVAERAGPELPRRVVLPVLDDQGIGGPVDGRPVAVRRRLLGESLANRAGGRIAAPGRTGAGDGREGRQAEALDIVATASLGSIPFLKASMRLTQAGPMITTSRVGKKQTTSGTVILALSIAARSSARCMRRILIPSAWIRSALATLVPNMSVWFKVAASVLRSCTPVRLASRRKASVRRTPAFTSRKVRVSSSDRMGCASEISDDTLWTAASSPRPASTQVTIEIQRVGKAALDGLLPRADALLQPEIGEEEAEAGHRHRPRHRHREGPRPDGVHPQEPGQARPARGSPWPRGRPAPPTRPGTLPGPAGPAARRPAPRPGWPAGRAGSTPGR